MVFKMLKGFGRLMLTTAVLCGVGLFLCGSEVKAATAVSVKNDGDNVDIDFEYDGVTPITITDVKVTLQIGAGAPFETEGMTLNTPVTCSSGYNDTVYKVAKADLLDFTKKQLKIDGALATAGDIKVAEAKVIFGAAPGNEYHDTTSLKIGDVYTIKVQKKAVVTEYPTAITDVALNKFTVGTGSSERDYKTSGDTTDFIGYALKGEPYVIQTSADGAKYYECIGDGTEKWYSTNGTTPKFRDAGNNHDETMGESNLSFKVQYFPKINGVTVNSIADVTLDSTKKLPAAGIDVSVAEIAAVSGVAADTTVLKNNFRFLPVISSPANIQSGALAPAVGVDATKGVIKPGTATTTLVSEDTHGTATVGVKIVDKDGTTPSPFSSISSNSVGLNIYPAFESFKFDPTTVEVAKGGTGTIKIEPVPKGAKATFKLEGYTPDTNAKKIIEKISFSSTAINIETKKVKGSGTASLTYSVNGVKVAKPLDITIKTTETSDIDPDESADKINKSYNYITVGYELNLSSLINNNLVSSEGKSGKGKLEFIEWDDDDDANKYVENYKSLTSDASKPSKTLKGKAEGKVSFTAFLEDGSEVPGIEVRIYPMPKATYSSDHKVTVTVPAKVSTGYDDDARISSGKGFKLIMEDSSGNSLYEYDDSKYQNVVSSPKDYKTDVAVSAADIEAMVTNAATNGKFNGDTQVKFKVIPMGYKHGSSSEITKANSAVNAKTDGAQVYQIKSTGTNFTDSYAYGLDGMTVNLTATPNTGFTFAKWTDGVTSNPRSIRVAASGMRAYTPEAKESAGGAGGDNSGLYDDVPKTAESNSAIWLIVFMVFAVMGTGYALYLQLTAASSKHGK